MGELPREKSLIHVALVSAFPTESDARAAIKSTDGVPYRGVWTHPTPTRPRGHVFSEREPDDIEAAGWGRTDSAPYPPEADHG